jgi:hypothetical protein
MKLNFINGFGFLILIAIIVYIPFIFFGGFGTSDDLVLLTERSPDYFVDLKYNLSRSGHISRPIYGFIQTTCLHLFKGQYVYYNITRFLLWFFLIYLAVRVFKVIVGKDTLKYFVFFLMFPVFTSSHLFNSMQMGYLLSMIFYLASLRSIQDENGQFTRERYFSFFFFSLLALLSCEIVFPLLIFPILYNSKNDSIKKNRFKLILTILLTFFVILILKFLIGPYYQIGPKIYGFNISRHSLFQFCYYFFAILIEIPLLLIEVLPFFFSEPILFFSLIIIPFFYLNKKEKIKIKDKKLFSSVILIILTCSFIFLFSDYPAVTYGIYNKMLLPSHLFICLVLGHFCSYLFHSKFAVLAYLIGILWLASMQMQIINSIRSWSLRNDVYNSIVPGLNKSRTEDDYVFVNVPFFLESNYNNEPVFSLNDDFQGGLILNGFKGNSKRMMLYNSQMLQDSTYWSHHNILNVISENQIEKFSLVELKMNNSSATKLVYHHNINRHKLLKLYHVPSHPECFRSEIRSSISEYVKQRLDF